MAIRKIFFILSGLILTFQAARASVPVFAFRSSVSEVGEALYFSYQGCQFQDEFLVFNYEVKFPGVTTLILLDSEGNEIWRNEYLDEIAGAQSIMLKKAKLETGKTYVFKFQFKQDRIMKAVTIP